MKINGKRALLALVFGFFLSLILASFGVGKISTSSQLNTFSVGVPINFFDVYFINGRFAANFNLGGIFLDAVFVYGVLSVLIKFFPHFSKTCHLV